MVIQARPSFRRNIISNDATQSFLTHEIDCFKKAAILEPFNMGRLKPSLIVTLVFPLLTTSSIFLASFLLYLVTSRSYLRPIPFVIIYTWLMAYQYITALMYRMFLAKESDCVYLAYVYVSMYSTLYFPTAVAFSSVLGDFGSIALFILVLITQYVISNTLTTGYAFPSDKKRFLFSLLLFAMQMLFLLSIGKYIIDSSSPSALVRK